jgi:hypothetical protein
MANPYRSYSGTTDGGTPSWTSRTPFSHNAPVCTLAKQSTAVRFALPHSTGAARLTGSLAAQSGLVQGRRKPPMVSEAIDGVAATSFTNSSTRQQVDPMHGRF